MQQVWDKNGNIYYVNDNGQRINNSLPLAEKLARKAQAIGTNLSNWINEQNPNSEAYKQKANVVLGAVTMPIGAGAKATQAIAQPLKPYVGRQIAKMTAEGIGAGATGGAVEGFGRGLIEGENPLITGGVGLLTGGLFGGLGGLGAGKLAQKMAFNNLYKNPSAEGLNKYFDDYIEGLNNYSKPMADYRAVQRGVRPQEVNIAFDSKNPRHRVQAEIVKKYNPAPDSYHTWIRSADDVFDFEDTLKPPQFDPDFIGNDFDPSYTWDMAQDAIKNGEIDVYSSYPIEKGVFVTPSTMEAGSYAGNGTIYHERVPLKDVAWIDERQGQYAPVNISENKSLYNKLVDDDNFERHLLNDLSSDGYKIKQANNGYNLYDKEGMEVYPQNMNYDELMSKIKDLYVPQDFKNYIKNGKIDIDIFDKIPMSEYERSQFNTHISSDEKRKILNRFIDKYRYVINRKDFDDYDILEKALIDDINTYYR